MRRRRIAAAALFAVVALVSFVGGAVVEASGKRPALIVDSAAIDDASAINLQCPAPSLAGTLPALVTLPPGYGAGQHAYPVIYFLHGLPANPDAYESNSFVASELAAAGRRAIVGQPQGARSANSDREYLDWSGHEDWPRAIAGDLVTCIDARFRTERRRTGRALIGMSAGGYGAFNIGLRNLGVFGAIESWSGYFTATDPLGTSALNLGSAVADAGAMVPSGPSVAHLLASRPTFLGFYVGDSDARFTAVNRAFDASLSRSGVPHTFRTYPGGHTGALWQTLAPAWLGMALDALRAEARGRRG